MPFDGRRVFYGGFTILLQAGRPTALAATEYLLLSKRIRQVFEIDAGTAWKPSNRPA